MRMYPFIYADALLRMRYLCSFSISIQIVFVFFK